MRDLHAKQPTRNVDEDGRCPACHTLADEISSRLPRRCIVFWPEMIEPPPCLGEKIPTDPAPAPVGTALMRSSDHRDDVPAALVNEEAARFH